MSQSAFCGRIDEIPCISVDNFENPHEVKARAYFLSHCHSDHTQGLYSVALIDTLEETGACVYMSEASAAIVDHEKTDPRLMKYVRPLKLGPITITLPSDQNKNLEVECINVTIMPAGHSFGSVMFLFRFNNKTVLFTGDFRMPRNDVPKYAYLHNRMDPIPVDAMYVDTTFIEHRYLNFPKRSESVESAIELMKRHLQGENNRIALHTSARYGYEFVYNEIHKSMATKVYVGERWKFYSKLLHLVSGVTNDESSTKIHLCRNMNEYKDHTRCLTTYQNNDNFLYVHFSAMKWGHYDIDDSMVNKISDKRMDVCFATHCSRSELLYFVKYFQPKKVVGFPETFPKNKMEPEFVENDKITVKVTPKKRKCLNNNEIKIKIDKKVDRDLLREMFEL